MVIRLATFEGQPDRFAEGHGYRYVLEAIKDVNGFVSAYHVRDAATDRALSISVWESEEAANAGEAAVNDARLRLAIEGSPPTSISYGEVISHAGA